MAVEKVGIEITAIDSATRVFNQVAAGAKGLEKTFDSLKATGATLGAGFLLEKLVEETLKWEAASFKLNATLKATGGAVGLTRKELDQLVHDLEGASPFDATDLREAEANLVKFGNIHEEVFKDALKLSADYAAFTGGSVAQASQALGRALVDPVNGLKALQREFGNLTFSQKEYIAQLEAQGKTEEAQIAILDIVRSKIGGTAEAAANTGLTGLLSNLKKAWGEAGEAAALAISKMPKLEGGSGMLAGMFNADPNMMGPDLPQPPSWQEGFDQQNARIASSVAKVNEQIDRQREAAAKAAPVVAQWTNLLKDQTNEQRALEFVLEGQGRTLGDLYKAQILNAAVERDRRDMVKVNLDLTARYAKALQDETLSEEENLATRVQAYESAWMVGTRKVFQDYIKNAKDGAQQAEFFFSRTFQNMEDAVVDFAMTGKLKFSDFARSVEADLLRIMVRQALAFGASQAGIAGFAGSLFGPGTFPDVQAGLVSHTGGVIGVDAMPTRRLPASTWAGAPRMHSGGLAGDEVPAILQRGERVIPRGGSAGMTINQVLNIGAGVAREDVPLIVAAARNGTMTAIAEARRRNPNGPFGG